MRIRMTTRSTSKEGKGVSDWSVCPAATVFHSFHFSTFISLMYPIYHPIAGSITFSHKRKDHLALPVSHHDSGGKECVTRTAGG